ncbi:hypothetical protein Dip510_000867 [Elusimicrobium posterum]|uniref:LA_2272 family surface repeat-containing protein n=1 Tax=Elusimicrobium posterum TaxID=3116653 RepID=UPI003C70F7B9
MKKFISLLVVLLLPLSNLAAADWAPARLTFLGPIYQLIITDLDAPSPTLDSFPDVKTVAGIDLGILGTYTPRVYGVQLSTLIAGGKFHGVQIGGLMAIDGGSSEDKSFGLQFSSLLSLSDPMTGIQTSALIAAGDVAGIKIAPFSLGEIDGLSIHLLGWSDKVSGVQIGVLNRAKILKGVQIGVINIADNGYLPFSPIINARF